MTSPNYQMWPYWRDKYFDIVDAMNDYYPEVLAEQEKLRIEVIRITAYTALIDKLMDAHEDGRAAADPDVVPLWPIHRADRGYVGALQEHYGDLLRKNEPLRVALSNILSARAAIDSWMSEQAEAAEE